MNFFNQLNDIFISLRSSLGEIYNSMAVWLEFGAIVISALLVGGIIYTGLKSNWLVYKVDEFIDVLGAGNLSKRRILRAWREILKHLNLPEVKHWKIAIISADRILAEICTINGYKGETVHDQLKHIKSDLISNVEELKQAHRVRDRIIQEPDFSITHEEAVRLVRNYAKAFREFGLID